MGEFNTAHIVFTLICALFSVVGALITWMYKESNTRLLNECSALRAECKALDTRVDILALKQAESAVDDRHTAAFMSEIRTDMASMEKAIHGMVPIVNAIADKMHINMGGQ